MAIVMLSCQSVRIRVQLCNQCDFDRFGVRCSAEYNRSPVQIDVLENDLVYGTFSIPMGEKGWKFENAP